MGYDWDKLLKSEIVRAKLIDFLGKSDYDFYKEISEGMSGEEFEKFCEEFPEARMVRE